MRYPVFSFLRALTSPLAILSLSGISVLAAVDVPGDRAVSAPLAVPGGSLRGEYWKRPVASILTDGAGNRANGIDNQINTFGPADGKFVATRLIYLGNDLTPVLDWLGADSASFTGTTNNMDDGAVRFRGYINVPAAGIVNLGTTSDDGSRITISGVDIINNDGSHGDATVDMDVNFLAAGLYPIEITYFAGDWTSDGGHNGSTNPADHGGDNFYLRMGGNNVTATEVARLYPTAPLIANVIVNVVETGGDNEATDTITAKWTGQTFPVSVANEPVPGAVIGQNYTVGWFGHNAPAYVDRNHRYADGPPATGASLLIPSYLLGKQYIMSGNDNRDNDSYLLDVTVSQDVEVYLLVDNRMGTTDVDAATPPQFGPTKMQWVIDQGWAPKSTGNNRTGNLALPDEVAIDENADGSIQNFFSVYTKRFPAGTFQLRQANNGGQNMYGVVVAPAGLTTAHVGRNRIGTVMDNGGGSFSIVGGGNDIWDNVDEFTYAYQEVTGDFDVKVRVESLQPNARWSKAGIMVRESLAEDSRMLFPRVTPLDVPTGNGGNGANDNNFSFRTGRDESTAAFGDDHNGGRHEEGGNAATYAANQWLRLVRVGNIFTSYFSPDGTTWTPHGGANPQDTSAGDWTISPNNSGPAAATLLVGLGVSRHSAANTANAEFRSFSVSQGSAAPFAVIGANSRGNPNGVRLEFNHPVGGNAYSAAKYTIDGGVTVNGATAGPIPGTVQLVTSALTEGTTYTVTVAADVADSAGNAIGPNTITFKHGAGYELRRIRIAHNQAMNDQVDIHLAFNSYTMDLPVVTQSTPAITGNTLFEQDVPETGDGHEENYAARVSGVLDITTAGGYRFYISSDDNGRLYLSSNDDPAYKVEIAREPAWNGSREYITGGNQASRGTPPANISQLINLTAGRYYLEVVFSEGGGGNNASAAWQPPGGPAVVNGSLPIPDTAFVPSRMFHGNVFYNLGAVSVRRPPTDITVASPDPATFRVTADGTPDYKYQWQRRGFGEASFTDIPGATGQFYTQTQSSPSDDAAEYRVVIRNEFSQVTSSSAVLHTTADTNAPTLVSAINVAGSTTQLDVLFSEAVNEADAETLGNYAVSGGVTLSNPTLQADRRTVRFTSTALDTFTCKTLTVNGIHDASPQANPIAANSQVGVVYSTRNALVHRFDGISGVVVDDLLNNPAFPNSPTIRSTVGIFEYAPNLDNYGARVMAFLSPPVSGDYTFYVASDDGAAVWLSTDHNPANKVRICNEPIWSTSRSWTGGGGGGGGRNCSPPGTLSCNISQPIHLEGGCRYYMEMIYKEGIGGDYGAVAWTTPPGGPQPGVPANGSPPIPGTYLSAFVLPATLVSEPQDISTVCGRVVQFCANIVGTPPLTIQWYKDTGAGGEAIPGANGQCITVGPVSDLTDSGARYYAIADTTDPVGHVETRHALLTVGADTEPPQLLSVSGSSNFYTVNLVFNENLDPGTAIDTFSYALSGGLSITQAVLNADGKSVTLFHEPSQTLNTLYEVTVSPVSGTLLDYCGNAMPETHRTFRSWLEVCGGLFDPTGVSLDITQQPASQTACIDPRSATQAPVTFTVEATAVRGSGSLGTVLVSQDFNANNGGFTVDTPVAYDGPWVYDGAAGTWKQDGQAAENQHANTSMLNSPAATITAAGVVQLTFVHRYSFESGFWDGGQVRISINGGQFNPVPGSAFTLNGYNGTVLSTSASALAGQTAFVENSPNRAGGQFITSTATLGTFSPGTTIRVQFIAASDTNTRGQFQPNWEIDSLRILEGGAGAVVLPVTIQWQRSVGGGAFADIGGATASTLTFVPTTAANGNRYRAVLCTQGATTTSSEATLTVIQANTAPSFACGPNQTVLEGSGAQSVPGFASNIQPDSLPNQTSGIFSNGFAGDTVIVPTPLITTFSSPFPGTRVLDPDGPNTATPDPRIENEILKLTDAGDAGGFGGFAFGPYDPQTVQSLNISWKSRIGGGGGGGADGYSLNIGSDLADNFQGEEGTGTGLSVAIDTFDNADIEVPDVGIEINWGALGGNNLPTRLAVTTVPKDNDGSGNYLRKDAFVNASLTVTPAGVATFTYDGNVVTATLPNYTGITFNQINFGARTGGANDNQWVDDFTTDIIVNVPQLLPAPAGTALYGTAYIRDGILHLTDAVNGQQGSFVITNDLLNGAALGSFTMTFDAQLGGGTTPPADGLSVSVANNLPNASWGEEGAGTGLTVAFDSYDNGGGEAPAIDVYWNGQVIAHTLVQTLETGGQFVPVSIKLDPDGTLDVIAAGSPVYVDLQTGYVPIAGARFGFGGRTGGLNERNWIDNLVINAQSADYSPAEAGQAVQFIVSNGNPSLFSAQPAISPNGTLTYTSAPDECGTATVTVVARDNGGTACNGADTSEPCTFTINVTCVNACPIANTASISVAAGGTVNFQLPASDPDGDPLQYSTVTPPLHGSVVVAAATGAASYTPNPAYTGPDSFDYAVTDGQCSATGRVSIAVGQANRTPVCVASVGPEACILRLPNDANLYAVSLDGSQACVVLDGSGSSDPDGDTLHYGWTVDGFNVSMDAAQEPGGSGGTGTGSGTVTLSGNTLTISIAFSGLSANANNAHIHGPAGLGTNAAVLYPLNALTTLGATAGTISGTVTLVEGTGGFTIAQQLQQLCDGLWYINIHTPLHGGGEIRGQIQPGSLSGATVTACLSLGCHAINLCVSDGKAASSCDLRVCVISAGEAVEQCVTLVDNADLGRRNKRPLIATLKAASAAFDRGDFTPALNNLEAFQNKVRAQIARENPAAAAAFIACAEQIIEAVECAAQLAQ